MQQIQYDFTQEKGKGGTRATKNEGDWVDKIVVLW